MNAPSQGVYFRNYFVLTLLLVATVAVSFIDLGILNAVAALVIAFVKMILIILFFMHVRYSNHLIWIASAVGFFWLGILIVLAMSDFISRGW